MPSFDVVSEVDHQEVRNAVDQASREVANRFDFKGTDSSIELSETSIQLATESEQRLKALSQVLEEKLVKRKVSLKHLDYGKDEQPTPRVSGKEYRLEIGLKEGINQETAKKIAKMIRDEGPKSVKSQIQGDELRVSSKSRDDLQAVQALLRGADLDTALQFTNYR